MRTLVACFVVLLASIAHAGPPTGRPIAVVSGEVLTSDGKPLEGVRVGIWTAYPREGAAYYCPSCYGDCGKSATTDEKGQFEIRELDDTLKFRLVVTREGYSPRVVGPYNPADGPLTGERALKLTARDWGEFKPKQVLSGRVLGPGDKPVAFAVIEAQGVLSNDGMGMWGAIEGLDPLAVSDIEGRFKLGYRNSTDLMSVTVSARGLAYAGFERLRTGEEQTLRLIEGAAVQGRLTNQGRAVADAEVAIYPTDRGVQSFPREEAVATDDDGNFLFVNVRPEREYWVYTRMQDAVLRGDRRLLKKIRVGADGSTEDIGEARMRPTFQVRGRVVVDTNAAPGSTLEGCRVFLSNNGAWDTQVVKLGADGTFCFKGVSADEYDFSFSDPKRVLEVSPRNAAYPFPNAGRLEGWVERDLDRLEILVGPKEPQARPRYENELKELPLRGVE